MISNFFQLDDQILKAMADGWPNLRAFRFVDCLDSVSCTGWRYFIDHISLLDSFSVPARISESLVFLLSVVMVAVSRALFRQFAYLCDRHGATLKVVDIQDELAKDWMPRKLISSAPIISVLRISLSSDVCSELKVNIKIKLLVSK